MIKTAPSSLPDALNQLPIFQGSISQVAQADTGSTKVRSGNYLDLRALGTNRLLVLEDGRRVPPTSNNGGTDTNLVPEMFVQRVDVVTGGASAAYGSDAVSGVVNFILDRHFEGYRVDAQAGISTYGDDASYKLGVALGRTFFDGRLHAEASFQRSGNDGIQNRASRFTSSGQNTESALTTAGLGTTASPYYYIGGVHNNASAYGGYVVNGPFAGMQFSPAGQLVSFTPGTLLLGRPGYGLGGDGVVNPSAGRTGVPSLTTDQAFVSLSYDVNDDITAWADFSYADGVNRDHNATPGTIGSGAIVFSGNAYLQPGVQAALGSVPSFTLARPFADWSLNPDVQGTRNYIVNAGIDGKFGDGYKWSLYYTHGYSAMGTKAYQINNQKFYAAMDAVRDPSGNIVCRVTLTNPSLYPGCAPLNILGTGNASAAAQAYVRDNSTWYVKNLMDEVAVNISGSPFSLWAGPVSLAAGAEYRTQSIVQGSNSNPAIPVDFTGLRGVTATTQYQSVNIGVANGSYNVKEVYGEIDVPLADKTAIGSADLNAAIRYTDYSTSGSVATWKVGGTYDPIEDIRIRGTVSRDIRAPSLYELFAGQQLTTSPLTDLHTGLSQTVNVVSGGNPNLKPERATTYTVGTIFSPGEISGLHFSIDYYNIEISQAIAQPYSWIQIDDLCEQSGGTSPLCAYINRPFPFSNTSPANYPTSIVVSNLNLASIGTSGLDWEGSYTLPTDIGQFTFHVIANQLFDYSAQQASTLPKFQYAGNADFVQGFYPLPMPKWRGSLSINYRRDNFDLNLQERFVGAFHISDQFVRLNNDIGPVFYTDLNVGEDFGENGQMHGYLTVNNLFNQQGPLFLISPVPGLNIPTSRNLYDVVGRYFTLGIRARF